MKKAIFKDILFTIVSLLFCFTLSLINFRTANYNVAILHSDDTVYVDPEMDIYLYNPLFQQRKMIYVGERLYDMPVLWATTADNKAVIVDSYVTWEITDSKKYCEELHSDTFAQEMIKSKVNNILCFILEQLSQEEIIRGNDDLLKKPILNNVPMEEYGVRITDFGIKALNISYTDKEAVYDRMITKYNIIATELRAKGKNDSENVVNEANMEVTRLLSEAQFNASCTKADGESVYSKIITEAYSSSPKRIEFYNFFVVLDSFRELALNGGSTTLDERSPLYQMLTAN